MATFTVNSDRRTLQPSAQVRIFDKAFFFSISLALLIGGVWALEKTLIYFLDKDIAKYQAATTQSLASVDTETIRQVEDFAARSALIKEQESAVSPQDLLATLEKATIPQVKLVEYDYEAETISLSGVTSDYRNVAEQLSRYRQEESLRDMRVTSTERSENGELSFSFVSEKPQKEVEAEVTTPSPTTMP